MKKTLLLALVFIATGTVFGQEFTFRGHQWEASIESIIAKERKPENNLNLFLKKNINTST
jgi:hypothetical protein